MATYEYDIPMPEPYKKLLLEMVMISKDQKSLTGFAIMNHTGTSTASIGKMSTDHYQIEGFPFDSFHSYELIELTDETRFVILPKAFKWADYEKKKQFGKWLARLPGNVRDIGIFIAFVLSVGLTILQIIAFVHPKVP